MKDTLSLLAQARAFLEREDKVQARAMLDSLLILQPKHEQAGCCWRRFSRD